MRNAQTMQERRAAAANAGKSLIVGLGKTGLSCARHLVRQGVTVAVTDSREAPPCLDELRDEMPDLALFLGGFVPEVFEAAEQLIVSPGVPVSEPLIQAALARGVPVIGDIELFAQAVKAPVVAITGSNGKSTVTSLVGEMARQGGLRVAVGGNLGEPALELLDEAVELYVLELSSFQLETTYSLAPRVATVLNISPDHMDRYPDIEAYATAKARIFRGAQIAVINRDDAAVAALPRDTESEAGFTLGTPREGDFGVCEKGGELWFCQGARALFPLTEQHLPGRHNLANTLAALALGEAAGLPETALLAGLRRFRGLPHRTQFVAEIEGVEWYNDSKGTNVGATCAALEGLRPGDGARIVLIAGGVCKGAELSTLAPVASDIARSVILIGRDAPLLEQALAGCAQLRHAADMEEAVALAAEEAQPGDRVLLSPACASFDMFDDFTDRGEVFMAAVRRL
ncbi:MAG TPA: UDP-N-acetylmuramoyl-L-alanine--D-glutamate ligase, partial [Kiloniellaceae bacterium]|nr:UDP-N-acetylmuramoyl-L-alanine--D-glutamate ligase [Kiloniellaceae bacterium]